MWERCAGPRARRAARRSRVALATAGAALTLGCPDTATELTSLPPPPDAEQSQRFIEEVPISPEELAAPELPAPPQSDPAEVAAAPVAAPARTRAPRKQGVASESTVSPPASTPVPVPLESLLRTPLAPGPPNALDKVLRDEPVASGPPPSRDAQGAWKDRVHVERHTEATGPSGPRQGSVSQTDAGVRIPVDGSVSVEGGVRVDQREDPALEKSERKSMPRVGVEVKF